MMLLQRDRIKGHMSGLNRLVALARQLKDWWIPKKINSYCCCTLPKFPEIGITGN